VKDGVGKRLFVFAYVFLFKGASEVNQLPQCTVRRTYKNMSLSYELR